MSDSDTQNRQQAKQRESIVGRSLCNGEYRVEAVLRQGRTGQVLLASHVTLDMLLALKQVQADAPLPEAVIAELDRVLSEDTAHSSPAGEPVDKDFPHSGGMHTDRFLREALFLARLHHRAIPTLYDYFFEDGYWYLAREYIPGKTLATYIRQYAPLPACEALNYAMQLCDLLDYLHTQTPPVILRNLQPSKVILTPDRRLMLVDFAMARYLGVEQENDTPDLWSPASGYMAPEQYQEPGQVDRRSDLFSLGVMLHEMISGLSPLETASSEETNGQLESLRQINPAVSAVLNALVTIATRREPVHRFQSAYVFYRSLKRAYAIEERHAHQQGVLMAEITRQPQRSSPASSPPLQTPSQIDEMAAVPYQLENEHMEYETQEKQLASIDESLRRRALGVVSPTPRLILEEPEDFVVPPRPPSIARRIVYMCFTLAMVLSLLLTSLLIYGRPLHHASTISWNLPGYTSTATNSATLDSSWQVLPSLPAPEADNAAVYVQVQGGEYVYMNGGYHGGKYAPLYDHNLYRYDVAAAHWEVLASGNFPAMVNSAAAVDEQNRLFFAVGYSPDVYAVNSLLYMYRPGDGLLQKIVPPDEVSIGFGTAIVADQQGHLYITQGFVKPDDPQARAGTGWYRYDIASGQWHILAPLPVGLGYVALAADGAGGIVMLGGAMDAGQHLPTLQAYRYNIMHNTWTQEQTPSPLAFSGAASCADGHRYMVIVGGSGGYDAAHERVLGQSWLVDLHTLRWQPLAPLPSGGSLLGAAACDGKGHVFLVRGADDPTRPTTDFLVLTIS